LSVPIVKKIKNNAGLKDKSWVSMVGSLESL